MKKLILTAVALALVVGPAGAASLSVHAGAALEGNFGMDIAFDDASPAYVVDTSPAGESVYTAIFKIDYNDVAFAFTFPNPVPAERAQAHHVIFNVFDTAAPPGPLRQHVSLSVKAFDEGGGVIRPKIWSRLYAPTNPVAAADGYMYRTTAGDPMEVNLPTAPAGYPVTVVLQWAAETGAGDDGVWTLLRDNNFAPGSFSGKSDLVLTGNTGSVIDQVFLGAVQGVDAATTGNMYFDSFSSFSTITTP